jgi:hypothetical protein
MKSPSHTQQRANTAAYRTLIRKRRRRTKSPEDPTKFEAKQRPRKTIVFRSIDDEWKAYRGLLKSGSRKCGCPDPQIISRGLGSSVTYDRSMASDPAIIKHMTLAPLACRSSQSDESWHSRKWEKRAPYVPRKQDVLSQWEKWRDDTTPTKTLQYASPCFAATTAPLPPLPPVPSTSSLLFLHMKSRSSPRLAELHEQEKATSSGG